MSAYREAVIADGAVGFWPLDEASGTTAADLADSKPGTYTAQVSLGATALIPSSARAASFATDGAEVEIGGFAIGTTPCFEVWLKRTGTPQAFGRLWSNGSLISFPFEVAFDTNGTVIIFPRFTTLTPGWQSSGFTTVLNTTYHLVAFFDGTTLALYINGASVYSTAAYSGLTILNAASTTGHRAIGNVTSDDGGLAAKPFSVLQDAAFYTTPLTPTQISTHYSLGLTSSVSPSVSASASTSPSTSRSPSVSASVSISPSASTSPSSSLSPSASPSPTPPYLAVGPVEEALYATLNVAALTTLAPGGAVDAIPQNADYPIVLYDVTERWEPTLGTKPGAGRVMNCDVRLHVFSTHEGYKECHQVMRECIKLLRDPLVFVPGYRSWAFFHDETIPVGDQLVAGLIVRELVGNFRAVVEEA